MITEDGIDIADAVILKVGYRWYICSEATCVNVEYTTYQYTTPTLKFTFCNLFGFEAIYYGPDDCYIYVLNCCRMNIPHQL